MHLKAFILCFAGLLTYSTAFCAPTVDLDERVKTATRAFQEKKFGDALTQFREIREMVKDPALRLRLQWNMARCLEEMKQYVQALRIFEDYAQTVTDPVRLSRAKAKIDKLIGKAFGKIAVNCIGDASARVALEKQAEEKPCPAIFERQQPGLVVIIGRGTNQVRQVVKVEAGQTSQLELVFLPKPVAAAAKSDETAIWPWYVAGTAAVLATGALTLYLLNRDEGNTRHQANFCFEGDCD